MKINDIFENVKNGTSFLTESGIQLPKGTKAIKLHHHKDMDGVFSAIVTFNQLVKQGIRPDRIKISGIQYGDDGKNKGAVINKFKRSKGQAVVLVDFARLPPEARIPDFWSDHHEFEGEKPKTAGKIGATEWKSDTSHLAILRTSNMVDGATLRAVDIVDSAGYTKLEDVLTMPKNFRDKGRMERLAILCNALLVYSKIVDNEGLMSQFIKETKPSLVSFYNNILKYNKLSKIQKEAIEELRKKDPNWEMVEKSRDLMPNIKSKMKIKRGNKMPMKDKIQEGALEDYEETETLKKKGAKRTEAENKRYKELVNKPIDDVRARRDDVMKAAKDSEKFESKGATLIQKDGKMQRYIWTQLNKKGLKHPFVIKRYPTFIQVSVNPELPENIKKHIDLNKIRLEVLKRVRDWYGNKYNKWAFDIIDKESGGHKGITNISGLGTLGIMPKRNRERLKELQKIEKRIGDLKTYGEGKLSPEDLKKLEIAEKMLANKDLPKNEREHYEKLQKILMPTMERLMPGKAKEMKHLLDARIEYAKERTLIMDDIEIYFIEAFKKYFNASRDKPVMGKNSDVKLTGGRKEYALESFAEELKL